MRVMESLICGVVLGIKRKQPTHDAAERRCYGDVSSVHEQTSGGLLIGAAGWIQTNIPSVGCPNLDEISQLKNPIS